MAQAQAPPKKLLAGFYDPEKRESDVMARLEKELAIFRKTDFTIDPPVDNQPKKEEKTLESIKKDISALEKEVDAYLFEDGHFTKQYRTFQGTCDKLLQQLDSLNTGKDEKAKTERGDSIKTIQDIVAKINKQVHQDGKCCPQCELYGTMWQ